MSIFLLCLDYIFSFGKEKFQVNKVRDWFDNKCVTIDSTKYTLQDLWVSNRS